MGLYIFTLISAYGNLRFGEALLLDFPAALTPSSPPIFP